MFTATVRVLSRTLSTNTVTGIVSLIIVTDRQTGTQKDIQTDTFSALQILFSISKHKQTVYSM